MKNKLVLEDDQYCFVCGKQNPGGLNLGFSFRDNKVFTEFTLRKTFQGYKDVVHGGIIAALLDEAMIKAALALGIYAVTAELTVRFRSPLFTDEKALVEAEVVKTGKRLIETAAHIEGHSGHMIAEGKGKLVVT
ncbi:MAG TPA: PaaI family thioesterase [Thermodesulfovibrionales bacterium]|nr:PaaI family thioesterase [Thermodesulfovibrionales bacterium]